MPFRQQYSHDDWGHDLHHGLEPPREDGGINRSTTALLLAMIFLIPILGPLAAIATCAMRTRTPRSTLLLVLAIVALVGQFAAVIIYTPWMLQQLGLADDINRLR